METNSFHTALFNIVDAVNKLRDTSSSHHRCSVVEVMGNHCGDLAIYSGLSCGAEILITPETGYDEEAVLEKLKYLESNKKNHAIVIVSEKVCDVKALADKIETILPNYTANGIKWDLGRLSHESVINALKAFDRFTKTQAVVEKKSIFKTLLAN